MPQLFDAARVSVVDRLVTEIDMLPEHYHNIRVRLHSQDSELNDIADLCIVQARPEIAGSAVLVLDSADIASPPSTPPAIPTQLPTTHTRCRPQVLYISKNSLKRMDGIQQFAQLRVLSAADNLLADYAELMPLRSLKDLQVASFEGNPMTQLPYYRYTRQSAAGSSSHSNIV